MKENIDPKTLKPKNPDRFVHVFKRKEEEKINYLSDQDKKHMRIIAIVQMLNEGTLDSIINHAFTEKFVFVKESQTAIYEIKLIKERKKTIYADS